MNKLSIVALLFLSLFLVSWSDEEMVIDESCVTEGTLEENLIGTWNSLGSLEVDAGTVTFNMDGTGVASENSMFNGEESENEISIDFFIPFLLTK